LPLPPGPGIRYLFGGGTIFRKRIDLLLAAFSRAIQPTDNVGLVIKDMGSKSFYRGQTAEASVAGLRQRGYPGKYIDRNLTEAELAGLYAACACLVHPFRGEGWSSTPVQATTRPCREEKRSGDRARASGQKPQPGCRGAKN